MIRPEYAGDTAVTEGSHFPVHNFTRYIPQLDPELRILPACMCCITLCIAFSCGMHFSLNCSDVHNGGSCSPCSDDDTFALIAMYRSSFVKVGWVFLSANHLPNAASTHTNVINTISMSGCEEEGDRVDRTAWLEPEPDQTLPSSR
jgi:hypothetical protein